MNNYIFSSVTIDGGDHMAMFEGTFKKIKNQTELEILKIFKTALYEVGYPGGKYLEKLQIITVIYQLYRAKDLARELQKTDGYQFKDLAASIYTDLEAMFREFEYLRDIPNFERIDLGREKLFHLRNKIVQLCKNVGVTDGEISNILRDYTPKPNEDLTSYRQKSFRR